jgi:hypothetical protein
MLATKVVPKAADTKKKSLSPSTASSTSYVVAAYALGAKTAIALTIINEIKARLESLLTFMFFSLLLIQQYQHRRFRI